MRRWAQRLFWIIALGIAARAVAAQPADDRTWYSIAAVEGDVLGHASRRIVAGPGGREIVYESEIRLQEQRDPSTRIAERTATRFDAEGRTISIEDYVQTGTSWARIEARIGADTVEITRHTPSERRRLSVPLPAGVRFDGGEGLLAAWDPAVTPRLEFSNFNIGAMLVERVTIEPLPGATADTEGRIAVIRKRYDRDELRAVARLLLDRERRIVAVTQPMFGTSITTRVTDRRSALRPHRSYQPMRDSMVRSPFRMTEDQVQRHLRYRFAFREGIEFALPQTGEQRVAARPGEVTVDICPACGPGLPTDAATLADALRPTAWLQSDDALLRVIAVPIERQNLSDAQKMALLIERARPYLVEINFAGHFSALETMSRRQGDCTEAAVLVAALARAAGIPAKVASGLVYSRARYHGVSNVFMPHSWVLAYADGQWRSFDLALGQFDSTHIALTIGDGDTRSILAASQLASLLRWEEMAEVRARPAP
jgi:hypothetical protein